MFTAIKSSGRFYPFGYHSKPMRARLTSVLWVTPVMSAIYPLFLFRSAALRQHVRFIYVVSDWLNSSVKKYRLGTSKCHDDNILTLHQPIRLQLFERGMREMVVTSYFARSFESTVIPHGTNKLFSVWLSHRGFAPVLYRTNPVDATDNRNIPSICYHWRYILSHSGVRGIHRLMFLKRRVCQQFLELFCYECCGS